MSADNTTGHSESGFVTVVPAEFVHMAQQYGALLDALRKSTREFDAALPTDDLARLTSCLEALRAVNRFLRADANAEREGLVRPLAALESAAYDAGRGMRPPLLKHLLEDRGKPDHTTREAIQGGFAWCLERLKTSATGLTLSENAAWLAAEARRADQRTESGSHITAAQMENWRAEIIAERGTQGGRKTFDDLERFWGPRIDSVSGDEQVRAVRAIAISIINAFAITSPISAPKVNKE